MRPQLILPAVLMAVVLGACGGGTPVPTASPSATLTPTAAAPIPSPTPAAPVIARVQVGLDQVQILATDDSEFNSFTLYQPASEVVAVLTNAFGSAPVITDHEGGVESPPSRYYDWSGFTLIDPEGIEITGTDLHLYVTTASVGSVQVYTYFDLQVGDPLSDAIAVEDAHFEWPGMWMSQVGSISVDPASVGEAPGLALEIFVAVYGPSGGVGTISHYSTPTPNWGV